MRFSRQEFTVGLFDVLRDDPDPNWAGLLEVRSTLDMAVAAMLLIPELTCEMVRMGWGGTEERMTKRLRYAVLVAYIVLGEDVFDYFFKEEYVVYILSTLCTYAITGPEDSEFDAQLDVLTDVIFECAYNCSPLDPVSKMESILNELNLPDEELVDDIRGSIMEMLADAGTVRIH
ncbi:MAG TPA: hypothetical protein VN081_01160 [Dongiaceae bacterium]|nr:hypothetical protein [Dongiaceae bacterium]